MRWEAHCACPLALLAKQANLAGDVVTVRRGAHDNAGAASRVDVLLAVDSAGSTTATGAMASVRAAG
jgi:hypothetical protein